MFTKISMEEAQEKANKEFLAYKNLEDKKYISDFDKEVKKLREKIDEK